MTRTKRLTFLTSGYAQLAIVFPFIVVGPAYFANRLTFGWLSQTADAFGNVQNAMSVIVNVYRDLAEWRAVIARLDGFDMAITNAQNAAARPPVIEVVPEDGANAVAIDELTVRLPHAGPLVTARGVKIGTGERILLTGPSGSGKSTLFRAIAGVWPFGAGRVRVPREAQAMTLPQRPYFPIGTLAAAVSYPAEPGTFSAEQLADAVAAVGLPELAPRLHEDAHWNRMLSLGEQQRLGLARALLQKPDYLFLDEATASLDEPAEAALYRLLEDRLPRTTIVSIGHRSTLAAFHRRGLKLERDGTTSQLREVLLAPAAE
jgi:putative ATP-binding cassette transporter